MEQRLETELAAEGTRDPEWAIQQAKRFVDAGAYMIMIESEGITENVQSLANRCRRKDHQCTWAGKTYV